MAVHRSMQGKLVDMGKLAQANELTPAVSNEKVNARGDKLDPGGKIIQRREDTMASYYENTTKVKTVKPTVTQPVVEEHNSAPDVLPPSKAPVSKKGE